MNRRSFFTTLAKAAAGFAILPAATTYARKWVLPCADSRILTCDAYISYLYDMVPVYDAEILKDWYPDDDAWIGTVEAGTWDELSTSEHTFDQVNRYFPDIRYQKNEAGLFERVRSFLHKIV